MHPITETMLEAQEAMILGRPIPVETVLWKMANAEERRIRQVLWKAKREAASRPALKASPAPPPAPAMTEPPPKVGSVLEEPPIPDTKPRRDAGPVPKIKRRKGYTKDQREAIVRRLHGINLEDATDTVIQLTDTPGESVVTFREPKHAHNLYYYLTGEKLFEEYGPYKPMRRGGGNGRKPDGEIILSDVSKAMMLYGNPGKAATILKRQAESYKANEIQPRRLLWSVISKLESRAGEEN